VRTAIRLLMTLSVPSEAEEDVFGAVGKRINMQRVSLHSDLKWARQAGLTTGGLA
jgi:hypothetical protein